MNRDGTANFSDINPLILALSSPAQYQATYPNCNILNGDINGDGTTNIDDLNPFVALLQGGGGSGLRAAYTYDGENRLVRVGPAGQQLHPGDQKVEYVYDYLAVRRRSVAPDPSLPAVAGVRRGFHSARRTSDTEVRRYR